MINDFREFLKTLDDMELVSLQKEARQIDDKESLDLILIELRERQRNRQPWPMTRARVASATISKRSMR